MTLRFDRSGTLRLATFAIALLSLPQLASAADEERYVDRNHRFSFSMPRFEPSTEPDTATVAVTLAGAPTSGFAPNVNVVVQNLDTTLDEFAKLQAEQLKAINWELVDQSRVQIGGADALRTRARGSIQGQEVEFLGMTMVTDDKKTFILTCTSTRERFPLHEAEFERVAASFSTQSRNQD